MTTRETTAKDLDALLALHGAAFPEEELRPLARDLLTLESGVLSLAAFEDGAPIAHAVFTRCETSAGEGGGALLGPLAVAPDRQRRGVGGALLRAGLDRLDGAGVRQVFVLGDPAYYDRFGFATERLVKTPFETPPEWSEAWRSLVLARRAPLSPGLLSLPDPWMKPSLWAP